MTPQPESDLRAATGFCEWTLRLTMVPGIGPRLFQLLIEHFGSPEVACQASPEELQEVPGIGPALRQAIRSSISDTDVSTELERCRELGIELLFQGNPRYPSHLRRIPDPPPILFFRGEFRPEDEVAIAIVGTRHATAYGKKQAERLASGLARAGCTIVSGLARGIDGVAHRAALEAGGRTLAVLGGGLATIYPAEHAELAREIALQGAVFSEFSSLGHVRPGVFPRRNRILSGLSLGVIVVEAGVRSGALSTARHAVEQNREVFAVPGPVDSRVSRGCHQLLRDGATLIEDVDDVLESLGPLANTVTRTDQRVIRRPSELMLNPQETLVLQHIDVQPTKIDSVVARTQLPTARVLATISALEMRRLVRRLSGQYVCRS